MSTITRVNPRLRQRYEDEIREALTKEFGYTNPNQVPRLVKVVVNTGVGEAARESKVIEGAIRDLTQITGQKPLVTQARKSIAQFKLREGMPIGAHVTLRSDRAWEFLDRLISVALPRIRDFRGVKDKFDKQGNYSLGIQEQIIFPEVDYDEVDTVRGLDIVFTIKGGTPEHSRALLDKFKFPFRKPGQQA